MIQKPVATVDLLLVEKDANSIPLMDSMSAEPEEPTVCTAEVPTKGEDVISTLPASMTPLGLKHKQHSK